MYRISDFEKSSKRMFIFEKLVMILLYIIIIPIIIYNLTLMIKSYINPIEIPDFFGFKSFVIISESMEPTFYKDDLVIVQKCKIKELKKGDIITFIQNDRIISHRIFGITKDIQQLFIIGVLIRLGRIHRNGLLSHPVPDEIHCW